MGCTYLVLIRLKSIYTMKNYLLLFYFLLGGASYGQTDSSSYGYIKPLFDFNPRRPLFAFNAEQQQNQSRYLRYWALTGYREGVAPTSGPFGSSFAGMNDTISGTRRLYMHNLSVVEMLTHYTGNNDRLLLEVSDPSKYRYLPEYGPKELWLRKNGRCFELMLPTGTMETAVMNAFLEQALGVSFGKQRRRVKALVLSRNGTGDQFTSQRKGTPGEDRKGRFNQAIFLDMGKLLTGEIVPFVDETGYRGLVDLDMDIKDWKDLKAVNKELARYALQVKEEMRELDMLVVTEKK